MKVIPVKLPFDYIWTSAQPETKGIQEQGKLSDLLKWLTLVSRPREFHPQPLAEPYVILSHHTAPIIQPWPGHISASGPANADFVEQSD